MKNATDDLHIGVISYDNGEMPQASIRPWDFHSVSTPWDFCGVIVLREFLNTHLSTARVQGNKQYDKTLTSISYAQPAGGRNSALLL